MNPCKPINDKGEPMTKEEIETAQVTADTTAFEALCNKPEHQSEDEKVNPYLVGNRRFAWAEGLKYGRANLTTEQAVDHLVKALKVDPGYRYSWLANIAMQFKDEWQRSVDKSGLPCTPDHIHEIANKAADEFLTLLCRDK